jgi:hypothetical protein
LLHQLHDFAGLGVASHRFLGEHTTPVDLDLEHAARRLDQFYVGVGVGLANLGRQTGSPGLIVSNDAEFDRHAHAVNDTRA